ncbi:MAG: YceI family protein [Bdellovibrionales bacterium]|nr:YceI family protein [Bdellovibrionales bacterium]
MILRLVCFFFILSFHLSPSEAQEQQFSINPSESVVIWTGKKLTGQHTGALLVQEGTVTVDEGRIVSGSFVMNMASISNRDIESQQYRTKLENHLKSDDFFNVSQFPTARFEIKKVVEEQNGEQRLTGDLTVKNITHSISFPVKVEKNEGGYSARGKVILNRARWDIKYNSGSFFDPNVLGDKLIYDDIEIEVEMTTEKQT